MPGICGIIDSTRSVDTQSLFTQMTQRMRHHPWYVTETHCAPEEGVALGRISLGFVNTEPQPARSADGNVVTMMEGEIYNLEAARRQLATCGTVVNPAAQAEVLGAGYARFGDEFLRDLNGSFVAVSWDNKRRVLTLVNDRFAMRPIYYVVVEGGFLFASSLAALLVDHRVPSGASKRGLAQFLTYGQYLGEETSVESIKVLPASCVARFEADTGKFTIGRYWSFDDYDDFEGLSEVDWLSLSTERFSAAVSAQLNPGEKLGLAISGGLDARTILAYIDQDETPVTSVCYGMRGSLDHRCSRQMTDLVNGRYVHYELGTEFLSDFRRHFDHMVQLTDGQYLSQCIVMPTLPVYHEHGINVLLRGHAGELMHMRKAYAYSLDEAALACDTDAGIEGWLTEHLQSYMLDTVDGSLLAPEYQSALEAAPTESLRPCLEACGQTREPVQKVWRMFIDQRLRRETSLSMAKFSSTVDIRLPYLDNRLVEVLLAAPPHMKMIDTFQAHMLAHRRPSFLDVVNANTGARMGASKFTEQLATLKMKVLGRLGVPGYQPYERLGLWLRRELAPVVEDILLSDQCRDRGIFDPNAIRRVVENHLSGQRNSTFLLMALMTIELQQRLLNDEGGAQQRAPTSKIA